jgi:hypothetical protein
MPRTDAAYRHAAGDASMPIYLGLQHIRAASRALTAIELTVAAD